METLIRRLLNQWAPTARVLVVTMLCIGLPLSAAAQINFDQAAILRWYNDNAVTSFQIGNSPTGIAFDGYSMWVTAANDFNVTKIHVNDGMVERVVDLGARATSVAYDGFNSWVLLPDVPQMAKVSSDGLTVTRFNGVTGMQNIVFDGTFLWVSVGGPGGGYVLRVRTDIGWVSFYPTGPNPTAMAVDGANLWVVNNGGNSVTKLLLPTAANLGTFAVGTSPNGISYDGTTMWVTNQGSNSVTRLKSDGGVLATYSLSYSPSGIAFDGVYMWITSSASNVVMKVRLSDGRVLGTYPTGSGPAAVAFDGANIWVVNTSSGTVSKM